MSEANNSRERNSCRNGKTRPKMPISERAKQFAPFAALTGLDEAIARKEWEHSRLERIEVCEDRSDDINRKLSEMYVGDLAEITYFAAGHYITEKGEITKIDCNKRLININGKEIHFKDVYGIR